MSWDGIGNTLGNVFGSGKDVSGDDDIFEYTQWDSSSSGDTETGGVNSGGGAWNWLGGILDKGVDMINKKSESVHLPTVQTEVQLSPTVIMIIVGIAALVLFGGRRGR
jgi:hypothetical protein